jgi:general secretion pathway protein A
MTIDFTSFFGLKTFPFDKHIKAAAAIDTSPFREALARLDFMKQRSGIMLLTGDPGVGKTIALRRFVDTANDNLFTPIYTPLTTLRGSDLLRHLNDKLGLVHRASKAVLYRQIQHEVLESREQRGKTIVFIIDEAHHLQIGPFNDLRLLLNFKMDSFDPFILVLAGHSDLKRFMDYSVMEPFSQRLAMRFHMPPLEPNETAEYVTKLMKHAGAREPIFKDDALAALHELAFGIPRRVGTLAEEALTYAMCANLRTIDADLIMKIKTGGT